MEKKYIGIKFISVIVGVLLVAMLLLTIIASAAGGLFVKADYLMPWDKETYLYYEDDRLNLISIVAFLEYVSIAGNQIGLQTDIELFPNGEIDEENFLSSLQNLPMAKVTITQSEPNISPLYNYIFEASTNRGKYKPQQITEQQISKMQSINQNNNINISFYSQQSDLDEFKNLILNAIDIDYNSGSVLTNYRQSFRANEYEKNTKPYGLYFGSQDGGKFVRTLKQGVITLFPSLVSNSALKQQLTNQSYDFVDSMFNVCLVNTVFNTRQNQIEAGRAFAKLCLKAHEIGLSIYPFSRTVQDYEKSGEIVSQMHSLYAGDNEKIQMFFKIGESTIKPLRAMRISATNVLKEK